MCVYESKHLLDLTEDSTHNSSKDFLNVARVFPFILGVKHKILHIIRAWAELEFMQKIKSTRVSIDRV